MRIANTGNVGIGTMDLVNKVHAHGVQEAFRQSYGGGSAIYRYDGTDYYLLLSDTETGNWNARRPIRIQHSNDNVSLVSGTGNGHVGIGTSVPTKKLQVQSAIIFRNADGAGNEVGRIYGGMDNYDYIKINSAGLVD